jgi:hypothetical protein
MSEPNIKDVVKEKYAKPRGARDQRRKFAAAPPPRPGPAMTRSLPICTTPRRAAKFPPKQ